MLKVALLGYGKMGHKIAQLAKKNDIAICCTIDPKNTNDNIAYRSLNEAEVLIDFSVPEAVLDNVKKAADLKKNLVIGTTAWYSKMPEIEEIAKKAEIGIIWGSNFSVGMNVFYNLTNHIAKLINKIDDYDIVGFEKHHNQKLDSPSGTAVTLTNMLLNNIDRKTKAVYETINRKIEPNELQFSSARCGNIPGTHEICFDSMADTIEIKHTARNRQGLASGAIKAAKYINGKKGFYDFSKVFMEILNA